MARKQHLGLAGWGLILLSPVLLIGILALANTRVGAPTDFESSPLKAAPLEPLAEAITLKLATYNIADGYLFTANRRERMAAIAELLTGLDPDVVGLQESFVESDREFLLGALGETRLRHHVRFPGAVVGNGLLILSAWPIEESYFHRFRNGGAWWRLWEGDWWAGKGIGLARIALPSGGYLDFYDTHAQAGRGNPDNERVRLDQMAELADFLQRSRLATAPAFVLGDFNTAPGKPDYELAVREAGLQRSMTLPSEIDHIFSIASPHYEVRTLDTVELAGTTRGSRPVLFLDRAPTLAELWRSRFGPAEETPLSDHPGYLTTVEIRPVGS